MGNIYQSCCQTSPGYQAITKAHSNREPSITITNHNAQVAFKKQMKLTWGDFQIVKYLCKSEIAQVATVKLKGSKLNKLFAMKIVHKNKIKQQNLLQNTELQTAVLTDQNPFIVKILHISQNTLNIYIVMEYIAGRDLYYYLMDEGEKEKYFSEETIRQVAAETLLGLEFLHSKGIIYRQLKPQNLLCTQQGHIKLTDYALSRLEKVNQPTTTYLGNMEYTSPEMLDKTKGYTRFADIWSFGVLLYELRYRKTPFKDQDPRRMQQKIKASRIDFPSNQQISKPLKDLIEKLTHPIAQKRPSIIQIKKHAFFSSIKWSEVEKRKNDTGLKLIIQESKKKVRGQHDNPPARVYSSSMSKKDSPSKVYDWTSAVEESFRTKQS